MTGGFYKKLSDLNRDELEQVWDNNKKLRERVFQTGMESACWVIDDWLHDLPHRAADYSIEGCGGDYFTVKNVPDFLHWLEEAQKFWCLLPENDEWSPWPLIEKAALLDERMDYLYHELSSENYERMESRRDEIIEELEEAVCKVFSGQYEYFYSDKNCFEYFVDTLDCYFDGDYWIDEDYILYHVYTRKECYA